MDSLDPASPAALTPAVPPPAIPVQRPPRIWKVWGTALWGLFIFAAMSVGQLAVVAWFILQQEGPIDVASAVHVLGGGLTISLSVITGLPAVLAALWLAIHLSRTPSKLATATPEAGEHNDEVLAALGYSTDQIAGFKSKGVI